MSQGVRNAQLVAIQNLMLSLLVLACHAKNVTGRWSDVSGLEQSVGCLSFGAGQYGTLPAATSDTACIGCEGRSA